MLRPAIKTAIAITLILIAVGCAKKETSEAPVPLVTTETPATKESKPADVDAPDLSKVSKEGGAEELTSSTTPSPTTPSGETPVTEALKIPGMASEANAAEIAGNLKLIRTASISCEVAKLDQGFEEVYKIAQAERGIVVGTTRNVHEEGYAYGSVTIKVVPERYDETVRALRKVGRLLNENSTTEDVTAEYVDLEARLANAEATHARYLEILAKKSASVQDILEVEREIERVTTEIERIKGQMRYLQNQVGLSTITVNLEEPHTTTPGGYQFGKAIKQAVRIAIKIVIFLIQAVIVLSPFIVILIILYLIIRLIISLALRRKKKDKEKATQ